MTNQKSLFIATVVHIIFKLSVFLEVSNCTTHLLHLPSLLVLASVCMILNDIELIPARYKAKGKQLNLIQTFVEFVACLFIIEIIMTLIWTKGEVIIVYLLQKYLSDVYGKWATVMANCIVMIFAKMLFVYASMVTGNWDGVSKFAAKSFKKVQDIFSQKKRNPQGSGGDCSLVTMTVTMPASEIPQACLPQQESPVQQKNQTEKTQRPNTATETTARKLRPRSQSAKRPATANAKKAKSPSPAQRGCGDEVCKSRATRKRQNC